MTIDPKDLADYAFDLYNQCKPVPCSELEIRTIINRAYYGAFLTARDFSGVQNTSGSIHREVIEHYQNKHIGRVSNNLDSLKRLRQKADYELDSTLSERDAKTSCRTANTIIAEINALPHR